MNEYLDGGETDCAKQKLESPPDTWFQKLFGKYGKRIFIDHI